MEIQQGKVWHTTLDSSGRVLVPADLRHAIGADVGTPMIWAKDEHGLRLRSFNDVLSEIQDFYVSLALADDVWSEALMRERRAEAARE